MKAKVHLWSHLAYFFLSEKYFRKKAVEKIQTHILCSVTFFFLNLVFSKIKRKDVVQWSKPNMTIWRTRTSCCVPQATNTHTHTMQYLLLFHCNSGCTNASQCYVIRTLGLRKSEVEVLLLREMKPRHWVIGTVHSAAAQCHRSIQTSKQDTQLMYV